MNQRNQQLARLAVVAVAVVLLAALPADAYRFIQNTAVGRTSAGYAVSCSNATGFTHWTTATINWRHNLANQGSNKATQIQNGLTSWRNVSPAAHNPIYAGTTTTGFSTNGVNTVLWASGNGCTGSCLAITALVLASGQVITETDISFNQRVTWTTNGSNYDTEAVWAHELGHTLGLHHTNAICSGSTSTRPTMCAYYFGANGRTLSSDDTGGLNCSYNRYPF